MYFNYDWWFGDGLRRQVEQAKQKCLKREFPDAEPDSLPQDSEAAAFYRELEHRVIVYLRDGYSYELGGPIEAPNKSYLTAECIPGDDAYKAGVFIVAMPFEDIARVEVFAVHPSERPQDSMHITGFRARPEG